MTAKELREKLIEQINAGNKDAAKVLLMQYEVQLCREQRFDEPPQNDAERLAVAMMADYAAFCKAERDVKIKARLQELEAAISNYDEAEQAAETERYAFAASIEKELAAAAAAALKWVLE